MKSYSIKDLETLTGIKAHTIRIWESRYSILNPERNKKNSRVYSENELKKLMNLSVLIKSGGKISKLAVLSEEELRTRVTDLTFHSDITYNIQVWIDGLTRAMVNYDEVLFDRLFNHCMIKLGFEETINELVFPFLHQLGMYWGALEFSPSNERFIVQLIERKLMVAIDGYFDEPSRKNPGFIILSPNWEHRRISMLNTQYHLRKNQFFTADIGNQDSDLKLKRLIKEKGIKGFIIDFSTPADREEIQNYLDRFEENFPEQNIIITGSTLNLGEIKLSKNVQWAVSAEHVILIAKSIAKQQNL